MTQRELLLEVREDVKTIDLRFTELAEKVSVHHALPIHAGGQAMVDSLNHDINSVKDDANRMRGATKLAMVLSPTIMAALLFVLAKIWGL
jgi:hypothetical protein